MRADYRQWTLPEQPAKKGEEASKPTKFHGQTTTRNDYPWPAELPPAKGAPEKPMHIVPPFAGERFDCGSIAGFLEATAAFALDRPELREGLSRFLGRRLGPALQAA